MPALQSWLSSVDSFVAAALLPLALAILISGVDDLFLDIVCLAAWIKSFVQRCRAHTASKEPPAGTLPNLPEKRFAIFVPLWKEYQVIAGMIEHNLAAIHYQNYDFFIGGYPNDEQTLEVVRELEKRFSRVHLAVCPHDGPTSKADCLNWIYQRMLLYEESTGGRFGVIITHDAEDLIHPEALPQINAYADSYDMVQIPVLPLPMPLRKLVHGIYCDEFAEWQLKDMPARALLGSFIPSNGVGTGYTRNAIEKLAVSDHNLIFEPCCLTEDYENGLRLHHMGCPQSFIPLIRSRQSFIATREYFPHTFHGAIRQRSRWVMGIALQTWERYGWRGSVSQVYWFWRDRKGLLGNPLSLATNLVFLYGLATLVVAQCTATPWGLARFSLYPEVMAATLVLQTIRISMRIGCTWRIYGFHLALGVPVRVICANYVNSLATFRALFFYFQARLRNVPLVWFKTEHAYPSRNALLLHKRLLGEILAGSSYISEEDLERALASQPSGLRLGEYLIQLGKLSADDLYEALSLQQSVPSGRLEPHDIGAHIARSLPLHVVRDWKVLPYRIASGSIFLASPEVPTDELTRVLRSFTRLSLRFHLVTPANFELLTQALL
jgi:adsorption protein B